MKNKPHILNLKYESQFWTPSSRDNINEHLNSLKSIIELRNDIKLIKEKIKTNDFTINDLSNNNPSVYKILIENDLENALFDTKRQLKRELNIRFFKERANRYLTLTGNLSIDRASIKLLEECRYLLQENKATIKEVIKILPSNHKLDLTISVNINNLDKLKLNF